VFAKKYQQDKILSTYVELHSRTNKYTNVKIIFYTEFFITPTCFDLS